MTSKKRMLFCFILLSIFMVSANQVRAGNVIKVNIKTVLASQRSGSVDPSLKGLTQQLQSVFRYSSYKLLGQDNVTLNEKTSARVSLPGRRVMKIISKGISGNRVTLQLEIFKDNTQIFQTVIKLLNRSSVTIGGPRHKNGNLLFNIFASF